MDLTEFARFCQELQLVPEFISARELKEIFLEANMGSHADDRLTLMNITEFRYCLELIREQVAQPQPHVEGNMSMISGGEPLAEGLGHDSPGSRVDRETASISTNSSRKPPDSQTRASSWGTTHAPSPEESYRSISDDG